MFYYDKYYVFFADGPSEKNKSGCSTPKVHLSTPYLWNSMFSRVFTLLSARA